jgi:hypothetical protein
VVVVSASVAALVLAAPALGENYMYASRWGGHGSANGQLDAPRNLAINAAGQVFVSDDNNHRIVVFSSTGGFVRTWGTRGTGDLQFDGPRGIAIDPVSSNVVVADRVNNRIMVFDQLGGFVRKWGGAGAGDLQCNDPYGVGGRPERRREAAAAALVQAARAAAPRRVALISIASGLESISTKRRPSGPHTAPSVPEPANGSRHQPPGREEAATIRRTMPAGFCVG